jgi:uncharacterized protein (DUF4415 family)
MTQTIRAMKIDLSCLESAAYSESCWFAIATGSRGKPYGSFLPERLPRGKPVNIAKVTFMRKEYDFTNARKNPYAAQLKKQITIRLDEDSIGYFKGISAQVGIPYQSLINLYLRDCAAQQRTLDLRWK